MLIGNTYYYKLVGDHLVAKRSSDTGTPCFCEANDDEVIVWTPTNGPGRPEKSVGKDVYAAARRRGIAVSEMIVKDCPLW